MLLITVDEVVQIFLPLRSFSMQDLAANDLGIWVFSLPAWRVRRGLTRPH